MNVWLWWWKARCPDPSSPFDLYTQGLEIPLISMYYFRLSITFPRLLLKMKIQHRVRAYWFDYIFTWIINFQDYCFMESVGGRCTSLAEREEFTESFFPTELCQEPGLWSAFRCRDQGLEGEENLCFAPSCFVWRRWPSSLTPLLTSCPGRAWWWAGRSTERALPRVRLS